MAEDKPEPTFEGWRTVLEREPEYLRAIGTMAVEIVNLEAMLAELLSVILRVHSDLADAIYFAPQAVGPRLKILTGAIENALGNFPLYQARALRCASDARELSNKRNDIIHHSWGFHGPVDDQVATRPLPFTDKHPARHVPLAEVKDAIRRTRLLAGKVIELSNEMGDDKTYAPSPRKPPEPIPAATPESSNPPKADWSGR
jgi:hypothetical protein